MTQNFCPGGTGGGTQEFLSAKKCPHPTHPRGCYRGDPASHFHYSIFSLIPQDPLRNGIKCSTRMYKEWTGRRGGRDDTHDDYRGGVGGNGDGSGVTDAPALIMV